MSTLVDKIFRTGRRALRPQGRVGFVAGLGLASLVLGAGASASNEDTVFAQTPLAIRASRIHVEGGQTIENGVVLIQGRKIAAVGAGVEIPAGAVVLEHAGELSAGLIALRDAAGARGEDLDSTRKLLPEAELAHAFHPEDADFEALVRAGVTSVVLTPNREMLAGGVTCVVKTAGGRLLRRRAHLALSFSAVAISSDRYPTSFGGVLAEYDSCFAEGKGAFAEASAGRLPILMDASARHEVQRAIAFAKEHKLKGLISGAPLVGELATELAEAGLGVVLPAYSGGMDGRIASGAVELANAGVPFGFALDSPGNDGAALRLLAAACLRAGLEQDVALRALTSDAAALAGTAKEIGRIAVGYDADLVLWSGSPLDLGSRVEAVYVDGRLAYQAPREDAATDDDEEDEEGSN